MKGFIGPVAGQLALLVYVHDSPPMTIESGKSLLQFIRKPNNVLLIGDSQLNRMDIHLTDSVRLQKFLADAGVCSRRKAEDLIRAGRVSVNHKAVTQLGTKVAPPRDKVELDGKPVQMRRVSPVTIILNKPRGYITSTESSQGKTVYDLIPKHEPRLLPIGRLDKDSEGVLLMTNKNDLISALTHPRYQHEKHYRVTISGQWSPRLLTDLNKPMTIGGLTMNARVKYLQPSDRPGRHILLFVLTEGKNRQVRRMVEAVTLKVHRLSRIQFAGISIKGVEPGKWRRLTPQETKLLSAPRRESDLARSKSHKPFHPKPG